MCILFNCLYILCFCNDAFPPEIPGRFLWEKPTTNKTRCSNSTVTDDNLESVGLHLYQKRCLYWLTFIFEKKASDFKVGTLAGVLAGFLSMSMLNTKGSVNTWFQKPRQVNPHLDWIVVCGPLSGIPKRPIYVQITGQNEALFRRKEQVKLQVGRKRRKFTNMSICMLRICCSVSRPIFMHRRSFSFF